MAFTIVTTRTILARNAGALYNLELGSTDMGTLVTQAGTTTASVDAFLNTIYTNSVGTAATTVVAAELVKNLGITDPAAITSATDYIVGQLNAVAYTARGAVVNSIISLFTGLTADPAFGVFATAYNTKVANAEAYAAVSTNTGNASFGPVSTKPAGQTFTLTAGIDTFAGADGNDTFNSSVAGGLSALDNLDGGTGDNTLTVSDTGSINISSTTKVANIQTATLSSGSTVGGDASSWTGLTNLTVSEVGGSAGTGLKTATTTAVTVTDSAQAGGDITVNGGTSVTVTSTGATAGGDIVVGTTTAPTGAVVISRATTGAVTAGAITEAGGTTVSITQTANNAVNTTQTNGTVSVTGGASTTSVTVNNTAAATASATVAGINVNSVAITDVNGASTTKAGTITSITVSGYSTLGISDNALTTLSVANGTGNIIIDNSGLTTPTNKTLGLTVNGLTGGTLDDADIYTTLNVTTTGANSTLANITEGAVATLTVAGTKGLTLTSTAGLTALKTVTVTGSAGITADLSAATVTAIDTSATTGASKVTVDGSKATFTGGAGADTVTTTAATVSKAISLGAGDDSLTLGGAAAPTAALSGGAGTDTLTMGAALAATASGSASFAGLVTGFERLTLTGATNQTIDLAVLGNFNYVTTSGGNGLTLSNLNSGGTLALTGAGTAYTIGNSAFASGTSDTVNLGLTDGSGAGVSFAATGITASGVENFVITTADTQATPTGTFNDLVTVLGNSAKTITVSGNAGLTLTAASTALTSVDASGITGTTTGGFSWTSGALAAAATVKGSVAGANTVDASAATGGAVTYTGGTGNDVFTATNGKANVVTLGDGTNSATVSSGNNTITGGTGADTVIATTGNNTVTLGNGANAFTATSGNNTYTGGTGVDTVTVGGGLNVLTLGTGADVVSITAAGANVNTYTTITDAAAGDSITFANKGTETFNTTKVALASTAVFQDYANAVVAAGGNASTNGAFGWFQFGGDTYLVESQHDGSTVPSFTNGIDFVVKLTGLIDLSTATGAGTATLTLV